MQTLTNEEKIIAQVNPEAIYILLHFL